MIQWGANSGIALCVLALLGLANAPVMAQSFTRTVLSASGGELHVYESYAQPVSASALDKPAPTVLALHGCGGMLNPQGKPNLRTQAYAKLLNAQGWHVVFTDSFTGRGVGSVCGGGTAVTQAQRLTDTQAAIAYLAQLPQVDSKRVALLGWSHGGTATLLAGRLGIVYAAKPVAALAFYPACGTAIGASTWQPAFPIRLQLGALDDWTDPVPCQQLAKQWTTLVSETTYSGAYHGFDSDLPVRQVSSIISRSTGQPVHQGGEPAAKTASQAALITYFTKAFQP